MMYHKTILQVRMILLVLLFASASTKVSAQADPWIIKADKIDPSNYDITVANGMIGIVSSLVPFKVKNVVLKELNLNNRE
jgi:hypothetical protein